MLRRVALQLAPACLLLEATLLPGPLLLLPHDQATCLLQCTGRAPDQAGAGRLRPHTQRSAASFAIAAVLCKTFGKAGETVDRLNNSPKILALLQRHLFLQSEVPSACWRLSWQQPSICSTVIRSLAKL